GRREAVDAEYSYETEKNQNVGTSAESCWDIINQATLLPASKTQRHEELTLVVSEDERDYDYHYDYGYIADDHKSMGPRARAFPASSSEDGVDAHAKQQVRPQGEHEHDQHLHYDAPSSNGRNWKSETANQESSSSESQKNPGQLAEHVGSRPRIIKTADRSCKTKSAFLTEEIALCEQNGRISSATPEFGQNINYEEVLLNRLHGGRHQTVHSVEPPKLRHDNLLYTTCKNQNPGVLSALEQKVLFREPPGDFDVAVAREGGAQEDRRVKDERDEQMSYDQVVQEDHVNIDYPVLLDTVCKNSTSMTSGAAEVEVVKKKTTQKNTTTGGQNNKIKIDDHEDGIRSSSSRLLSCS
ncbi:unnamed protein product, partial [Amoebophrya sp. A120]